MNKKIRLGISSCLLGENVRYDGGHKQDHYIKNTLGKFVEWVPVCPEVECGLKVPREAMRLVGDLKDPRLVTGKTGVDHTLQMKKWVLEKLKELEKKDLCGFIFKSKSPSSGMRGVKVYSIDGKSIYMGRGIFAGSFMDYFPHLPVEDEGRLHDPGLRENFIERVFVFRRWKEYLEKDGKAGDLVLFHSHHKLLFMAHSPAYLRRLGKIAADGKNKNMKGQLQDYFSLMMDCMNLQATVKKNTNVLQHIMGYFKKLISNDEKQELLEIIDNYHDGLIPLVVPVSLLQHYVRKYSVTYLMQQHYLHPHPVELMLRNHV